MRSPALAFGCYRPVGLVVGESVLCPAAVRKRAVNMEPFLT